MTKAMITVKMSPEALRLARLIAASTGEKQYEVFDRLLLEEAKILGLEKNKMATRPATKQEIRDHYKSLGLKVRIDSEGHVTFKKEGESNWLEGRWVNEYRVDDERGVYLR